MNVIVIGGSGQLGVDVISAFTNAGHSVQNLTHELVEIADLNSCRQALANCSVTPNVVIDCAAFHQLERCEETPQTAFAVNALGARNLALLSREFGFLLVYISTDYVFDGISSRRYLESDCPSPLNVYGNTKLSGELFVRAISPHHQVVRVSGLYGLSPCRGKGGRNFVQRMLELAEERKKIRVVTDEVLSPTYTVDAARQLLVLADSGETGLFHATAQGQCSWYEFAKEIFEITGADVDLQPAEPGEFPVKTSRPKFSALENGRLKALGIDVMPDWSSGLRRYLSELDALL